MTKIKKKACKKNKVSERGCYWDEESMQAMAREIDGWVRAEGGIDIDPETPADAALLIVVHSMMKKIQALEKRKK